MADSAPDSPLELGATGWRHTLARGVRKYLRDRCGMMAASLAQAGGQGPGSPGGREGEPTARPDGPGDVLAHEAVE